MSGGGCPCRRCAISRVLNFRPDGHASFSRWSDAYNQAAFRADLTGRRYRVHYDPANRWWNITELTTRHQGIR